MYFICVQILCTFNNEVEYLNKYFNGYGMILGSLNNARWYGYTNEIINVWNNKIEFDKRMRNGCCIPNDCVIDTYLFKPCGYSLNGILNYSYWTIHITFETNYCYDNYKYVIEKIVDQLFKPKTFSFGIDCYNNNGVFDVFNGNNNWKLNGFEIINVIQE